MINKVIKSLIDNVKLIPGIGARSAENIVFYLLQNRGVAINIENALKASLEEIKSCRICHNLAEKDICKICESRSNSRTICVLQDVRDLVKIEKTKAYYGKYHILSGKLDPIQNINPEHLNIGSLLSRIARENIEEIIIATDFDTEGELTAQYLKEQLQKKSVKITRLANGMPTGSRIASSDIDSVKSSFNNRN